MLQRRQRLFDRGQLGRATAGGTDRQVIHGGAQPAHRMFQRPCRLLHHGEGARRSLALTDRVTRKLHQRPRAQRLTEELRGEVG